MPFFSWNDPNKEKRQEALVEIKKLASGSGSISLATRYSCEGKGVYIQVTRLWEL
jgi:hypothetical protein